MALTNYVYSIASDTLNGIVALSELDFEVRESNVTIALDGITVVGDVITLTFKDSLPTADVTELDSVLNSHDGSLYVDEAELVKVLEESLDPTEKTGGHYRCKGLDHIVPASDPVGDVTYTDFHFPYNTSLMDMKFVPTPEMNGDRISVIFAPETLVGTITADVSVNDSVVNVSPTVSGIVEAGYTLILNDGTNEEKFEIVEVDKINNTVTIDGNYVNAYAAVTPTFVKFEVIAIDDVRLNGQPVMYDLGDEKIGGSPMKKDISFRFLYTNNEGSAKTFTGLLGFLY